MLTKWDTPSDNNAQMKRYRISPESKQARADLWAQFQKKTARCYRVSIDTLMPLFDLEGSLYRGNAGREVRTRPQRASWSFYS